MRAAGTLLPRARACRRWPRAKAADARVPAAVCVPATALPSAGRAAATARPTGKAGIGAEGVGRCGRITIAIRASVFVRVLVPS